MKHIVMVFMANSFSLLDELTKKRATELASFIASIDPMDPGYTEILKSRATPIDLDDVPASQVNQVVWSRLRDSLGPEPDPHSPS